MKNSLDGDLSHDTPGRGRCVCVSVFRLSYGGIQCGSTGVCRRGFVSRILTHTKIQGARDYDVSYSGARVRLRSLAPNMCITFVTGFKL